MEGGNDHTNKQTFITHVFSTTDEGKAEVLNITQYSLLGLIPIVLLNKFIQRFVPEATIEKSSLEILVEVLIQLIIMFCGILFIHRMITYVPTYSGYKYDTISLTSVILGFLIIVLSIQTKMGIKVNILFERLEDLWTGEDRDEPPKKKGRGGREGYQNQGGGGPSHSPGAADHLDDPGYQQGVFPPAPTPSKRQNESYDTMMRGNGGDGGGPIAANALVGSSFGSLF